MNTFSASEMVRLELLAYPTPEGLHPVEEQWRDLARKLLDDVKELETALSKHHGRVPEGGRCFECGAGKGVRNFPKRFTTI
jgi:hypothetical protein